VKIKETYLSFEQVKSLWDDYCIMDIYYDYPHRNFVDLMLYRSAFHLYKQYMRTYNVQGIVLTRKIFRQIERDYESFVTRQFQLHPAFNNITGTDFVSGLTIAVMLEAKSDEISNRFKEYMEALASDTRYFDKAYIQASNHTMIKARGYALKHLEDIENERRMEADRLASGSSD
jgi:hypothetical protein